MVRLYKQVAEQCEAVRLNPSAELPTLTIAGEPGTEKDLVRNAVCELGGLPAEKVQFCSVGPGEEPDGTLVVPPLCDRMDDIPLLVNHWLQTEYSSNNLSSIRFPVALACANRAGVHFHPASSSDTTCTDQAGVSLEKNSLEVQYEHIKKYLFTVVSHSLRPFELTTSIQDTVPVDKVRQGEDDQAPEDDRQTQLFDPNDDYSSVNLRGEQFLLTGRASRHHPHPGYRPIKRSSGCAQGQDRPS